MIWEETRWESKVKEKWGKSATDEPIAGNTRDFRIRAYLERLAGGEQDDRDQPYDDRAA